MREPTNPSLLDEAALAGIEARHERADAAIDYDAEREVVASLADIPALCATVRVAWAEIEKQRQQYNALDADYADEVKESDALREQLAEAHQFKLKVIALCKDKEKKLAQWAARELTGKDRDDAALAGAIAAGAAVLEIANELEKLQP